MKQFFHLVHLMLVTRFICGQRRGHFDIIQAD
jgi:hypothetical protein